MTSSKARQPIVGHVVVSHTGYVAIWVTILLFQIASAAFLVGAAYIYLHFTEEDSMLQWVAINYLFSEPTVFLMHHHTTVGIGYAVISVPFIYGSARMIAYSLWRRQLAFGAERRLVDATAKPSRFEETLRASLAWLSDWALTFGLPTFGQVITFRGKYFVQTVLVIESLQLVLQTIQGYRFSKYNSNFVINQVYGVMIFMNALSSPIIHLGFARSSTGRLQYRLYCVLVDTVLDFMWGIIIQLAMFAPYWRAYVNRADGVDVFGLLWESADRQLRQVLVVSMGNFVLSAFPFITSALVYRELQDILGDAQRLPRRSLTRQPTTLIQEVRPALSMKTVVVSTEQSKADELHPWINFATKVYMLTMATYGLSILAVSITASGVFFSTDTDGFHCVDRLYPWFRQSRTCVGRQIHCDSLGISGQKDDLQNVFRHLDPFLIGRLDISNCRSLEMPSNLHQYDGLVTLSVLNSTIMEWNLDAALTDPYFPELQTLVLTDVHVVGSPDGFIAKRLPSAFEWIFFLNVNANDFMEGMSDEVWSGLSYVVLDNCQLTRIPHVVAAMPNLLEVIIRNNPIAVIEAKDFDPTIVLMLQITLDRMPLTTLSDEVWDRFASQLRVLSIQSTNISSIPEHVNARVNPLLNVRAFGTPLCERMVESRVQSQPWLVCDFVADW